MNRTSTLRFGTALMVTVSGLSLALPTQAGELLFASTGDTVVSIGERVSQMKGLKQVRMKGGAVVSILDAADYRLNADGSIDLYAGSVTVAGGDGSTVVRMPDGVEGRVTGRASAASFSVGTDGKGRGHVLSGQVQVGRGGDMRSFDARSDEHTSELQSLMRLSYAVF